jgi:hypothetical protein
VLAQTQGIHVQRLSPENKEVSPYIPLQAGYRSKKAKLNPHMAACDLLAISFPQCYVSFFMFQFFNLYLSALPSLPLPHFQNTTCLFLFWSSSVLTTIPTHRTPPHHWEEGAERAGGQKWPMGGEVTGHAPYTVCLPSLTPTAERG